MGVAVLYGQLIVAALCMGASAQFAFPVPALGGGGLVPPGAHLPSPMHMPVQVRQPQMPVVVMPYRSKATDRVFKKRRRRPQYSSGDSSSDSDSGSDDFSSSGDFDYRGSRRHRSKRKKKREVLTPVISYVTRSGRVVYQKKVKKENPADWLQIGKRKMSSSEQSSRQTVEPRDEMTVRDLRRKLKLKKHKHRHQ